MAMAVVDDSQLKPIIAKNTDFFGDKKKFRDFAQDMKNEQKDVREISDVDLQCLGYGHFDPNDVMERFEKYLTDLIDSCKGIRSLKIQFNGFDLGQNRIMMRLAKKFLDLKETLKVLWVHTTHLINCRLEEFEELVFLTHRLGNQNFEEISLQFSHWKFQSGPPPLVEVQKVFLALLKDNGEEGMSNLKNRKFRLEMSGWYYDKFEAKWFLGFALTDMQIEDEQLSNDYGQGYELDDASQNDAAEKFHMKIHELMIGLLNAMPRLHEFQIDFRNWSQFLKMKVLKKVLDNIKKDNTFEKSLVSKKQQILEDEDQKELRMAFVV